MNPLLREFLGSTLRHLLSGPVAWMVGKGIFPESAAGEYTTAAVGFVLSVAWAYYQKYASRSVFVTALASPKPTTEDAVKFLVGTGNGASVMTRADVVPQMASGLAEAAGPATCVVCGLAAAVHGAQIHPFQPKDLR